MKKVFTTFDSKAEAYSEWFFATTRGLALRGFSDACNNPEHPFSRYPHDITLFEIGTWDELTNTLELYEAPENLGMPWQFIDPPAGTEDQA